MKLVSSFSIRIVPKKLSRSWKTDCSHSNMVLSKADSLALLLIKKDSISSSVKGNIFFHYVHTIKLKNS